MRWPPAASPRKDGCPIDQETVNGLIDHAIERGINYFDTAPIYGQGWSETVTWRALKRHPREKFLIATKMSGASDHSRENLTAMYRRSFQNLQVDYIDYYLLHGIGGGGRLANVTQDVLARMKQKRPDDTAAAWAFRFAGSLPKVLTVLSGMTYKEHLQDNLRTFSPLNGPTAP